MKRRRTRRIINQMNVVPYIDVMLVLLIIFMITSPMLDTTEGVNIDLPEVSASPLSSEKLTPILVKISATGQFFLTDDLLIEQAMDIAELGPRVVAISQSSRQRPIVISGDKDVPYGEVVKFMAFLEGNGVKVRLLTRSPPPSPLTQHDSTQSRPESSNDE